MLHLVLSSDSHVFEPPDLWQTRIDRAFRDRAPRIERIDGADQIVVEADQILSGIGLISNAGARFEAPETISGQGRLEDVQRGGYDPEQHLKDMAPWPWRRENRAWISSSARANQACQVVALLTRSLGQREAIKARYVHRPRKGAQPAGRINRGLLLNRVGKSVNRKGASAV